MGRFARTDAGLRVRLAEGEVELLRRLCGELHTLYEAEDDPVRSRLFPRAYLDPTQEESEREWQSLVHPELLRERIAAIDALLASLTRATERRTDAEIVLADGEPDAWLSVLNDARLALGTRLGVTEDTDLETHLSEASDDAEAAAYEVYAWLTWLEGDLVEALLT